MSESSVLTQCSECRSRFHIDPRHEGRRVRCPSCNGTFKVEVIKEQPKAEKPRHAGVNCRLCGTRLYGRLDQVGQPLSCPDCDTETILPAPKPKTPSRVPAAMEGDQYELWDTEDQPWGSELAARQAEMVAVRCLICETLQYVPPKMVGQKVACPDCGHENLVRQRSKPEPESAPSEPDLEVEPIEVDESYAPSAPPIYSRLQDFEGLSEEEQQTAISRVATNRKERPKITRFPLLSGWGAFLYAPGVLSRGISLGIALSILLMLAVWILPMLFVGYGAVAGLPILVGVFLLVLLCLGYASACAIRIVTESSEGNSQIADWPIPSPPEWLGETLYMSVAVLGSGILGYLAAWASGGDLQVTILATALSAWLMFPVIHLSTLEASSPWALLMPRVLESLGKWLLVWLQFYVLTGFIVAAYAGVFIFLAGQMPSGLPLMALPAVIGCLIYFRLIGRLAWRIRYEPKT